ncbi:hypothetical protein ACGF07_31980 [Kitasatospora sp. NPDC048194]|uniref:hypothetical protein n=1 Tax=Kitasatospora sp. NPDC048194 TaxID=3364045 RepID=UPI00371B179C
MARRAQPAVVLPTHSRILIPVLSAVGGSGRTTTAGLLATGMSQLGSSVVADLAHRLASPWPAWAQQPGAGLVSIPPHLPLTRRQIRTAATTFPAPDGGSWQVLTDHQEWSAPALRLPDAPAAWQQLAAAGGWQVLVADTAHPVAHDIVSARTEGRTGLTAAWCALPFAVPVLAVAATASGMQAAQIALMAATAEGLPLDRMVVALVGTADGRLPAAVKAGETMLAPMVSAVVRVDHDPQIRAYGLRDVTRLSSRSAQAATALARAVLASAHASWGDPLPAAPAPAAAPLPVHVPEKVSS